MSFMSEFKEFAVKGNAMDLAVGVIIGAALARSSNPSSTIWSCRSSGGVRRPGFSNLFVALGPCRRAWR